MLVLTPEGRARTVAPRPVHGRQKSASRRLALLLRHTAPRVSFRERDARTQPASAPELVCHSGSLAHTWSSRPPQEPGIFRPSQEHKPRRQLLFLVVTTFGNEP